MAKKQINVRVEEDVYATIEERAKAAGMEVPDYARTVLSDEGNDLRHRFLSAGAYFAQEWGDHFAERFSHPTAAKDEPRGKAA